MSTGARNWQILLAFLLAASCELRSMYEGSARIGRSYIHVLGQKNAFDASEASQNRPPKEERERKGGEEKKEKRERQKQGIHPISCDKKTDQQWMHLPLSPFLTYEA